MYIYTRTPHVINKHRRVFWEIIIGKGVEEKELVSEFGWRTHLNWEVEGGEW